MLQAETKSTGGIRTYMLGGDQGDGDSFNDYENVAKQGFLRNADVNAAVRMYANALQQIPWVVRTQTANKRRQDWDIKTEHPFYSLWERPNPIYTQSEWITRFIQYNWLGGEVFVLTNGAKNGPIPTELWLLRPDRIEIKGTDQDPVQRYEYKPDSQKPPEIYPAVPHNGPYVNGQAWHVTFPHPLKPLRGLSPFVAASLGISLGNSARISNNAVMKNGFRTSGALTLPAAPDEEQKKYLKQLLGSEHAGVENDGKAMLLWGTDAEGNSPFKWIEMGMSPRDADWFGALQLSTADVSKVTAIPPQLLADQTKATFANYAQASRSVWTDGYLPYVDSIRDAFNAYIMPRYKDNSWLDYDKSEIGALHEDENDKWTRANAKFITMDEARNIVGMPPLEPKGSGNVLFLGASDIPIAPEDLLLAGDIDATPNDPGYGSDSDEDEDAE